MKRKLSITALMGFILALAAQYFAMTRPNGPQQPQGPPIFMLSIPIGILAILVSASALRPIYRARPRMRGGGLSIAGILLGAAAALGTGIWFVKMATFMNQMQARNQQVQKMRTVRLPDKPADSFTSNLPIVVLTPESGYIPRGGQAFAKARFIEPANGRASGDGPAAHEGLISIHSRGHSSQQLPKQSFTFHLLDSQKNQTKAPLLGLPAEEDWILYAPFEDKTLMRDVLAYELARQMGRYAPRTRYVELFVRKSSGALSMQDYEGIYVLMEKIKQGPHRVNIAKLKPQHTSEPEISGGYIIKRDHGDDGGSRFHTSRGGPYFFVYPSPKQITQEQKKWLINYFNQFEAALYGNDFKDPRRGYAAWLDVDAFIDSHWLIELSKNVDGFRYSAYITKDRNGKLQTGPAWDWNRAFGNANYYGGGQTSGWYSSNLRDNEISWYFRLQEDPKFMERCNARWTALRKDVLDLQKLNSMIDRWAAELEEAQQRNFKRWPILGQPVTCNFYVGATYREEVDWLKKWIERRVAWIDGQVNGSSIF